MHAASHVHAASRMHVASHMHAASRTHVASRMQLTSDLCVPDSSLGSQAHPTRCQQQLMIAISFVTVAMVVATTMGIMNITSAAM